MGKLLHCTSFTLLDNNPKIHYKNELTVLVYLRRLLAKPWEIPAPSSAGSKTVMKSGIRFFLGDPLGISHPDDQRLSCKCLGPLTPESTLAERKMKLEYEIW
jgi:hypothetical protein